MQAKSGAEVRAIKSVILLYGVYYFLAALFSGFTYLIFTKAKVPLNYFVSVPFAVFALYFLLRPTLTSPKGVVSLFKKNIENYYGATRVHLSSDSQANFSLRKAFPFYHYLTYVAIGLVCLMGLGSGFLPYFSIVLGFIMADPFAQVSVRNGFIEKKYSVFTWTNFRVPVSEIKAYSVSRSRRERGTTVYLYAPEGQTYTIGPNFSQKPMLAWIQRGEVMTPVSKYTG